MKCDICIHNKISSWDRKLISKYIMLPIDKRFPSIIIDARKSDM